jgi:RNA polymerase sigma factor (sigma-70 family)
MAIGQWSAVVRQVNRLWTSGTSVGQSETQLLDQFAAGDESAFEALVARHGSMVHGVCRRVLRDPNDADDAFQATFLVLARKAGSLRDGALLGNWLYGVARRVSTRARADAEARRRREADAGQTSVDELDVSQAAQRRELAEMVQVEVDRLPSASRAVVVLCDLSGCSHEEAASRLGLPLGTVKSRHFRARNQLKARLKGRGLAPNPALAAILTRPGTRLVPRALLETTARAACSYAAGRATLAGLATAHAASLAQGVLTTMLTHQFTLAATVTLTAALLTAGAGVFAQGPPADAAKSEVSARAADENTVKQAIPADSKQERADDSKSKEANVADPKAIVADEPKPKDSGVADAKTGATPAENERRVSEASSVLNAMLEVSQSGGAVDVGKVRLWLDRLQKAIADRDAPKIAEVDEQIRALSNESAKSEDANVQIKYLKAKKWRAQLENNFKNASSIYQGMTIQGIGGGQPNAGIQSLEAQIRSAQGLVMSAHLPLEQIREAAKLGVEIPDDQLKYWLDRHKEAVARLEALQIKGLEDNVPGTAKHVVTPTVALGSSAERAKRAEELRALTSVGKIASIKKTNEQKIYAFADLEHLLKTGEYNPALANRAMSATYPTRAATPKAAPVAATGANPAATPGVQAKPAENLGGIGGGAAPKDGAAGGESPGHVVKQIGEDAASLTVGKVLSVPITMKFPNETPLEDVLKHIKSASSDATFKGLTFYIDPEGLAEAERTTTSPVSLDLDGFPLRTGLKLVLNQLGLVYIVRDGLVIITSQGRVEELDTLLSDGPITLPRNDPKNAKGESPAPAEKPGQAGQPKAQAGGPQ